MGAPPLVFLALASLALLLVLYALWQSLRALQAWAASSGAPPPWVDDARQRLLTEKERLLRVLGELESEHAQAKLSEQDYDQLREKTRAEAREILHLLQEGAAQHRAQAEALVEAEWMLAPKPTAAPGCACGTANDLDARFCKACGRPLAVEGA